VDGVGGGGGCVGGGFFDARLQAAEYTGTTGSLMLLKFKDAQIAAGFVGQCSGSGGGGVAGVGGGPSADDGGLGAFDTQAGLGGFGIENTLATGASPLAFELPALAGGAGAKKLQFESADEVHEFDKNQPANVHLSGPTQGKEVLPNPAPLWGAQESTHEPSPFAEQTAVDAAWSPSSEVGAADVVGAFDVNPSAGGNTGLPTGTSSALPFSFDLPAPAASPEQPPLVVADPLDALRTSLGGAEYKPPLIPLLLDTMRNGASQPVADGGGGDGSGRELQLDTSAAANVPPLVTLFDVTPTSSFDAVGTKPLFAMSMGRMKKRSTDATQWFRIVSAPAPSSDPGFSGRRIAQMKLLLGQLRTKPRKALLNKQNRRGYTALHYLSDSGDAAAVRFLLEKRDGKSEIKLALTSVYGWQAIHHAAHRGHLQVVTALCEHSPNDENNVVVSLDPLTFETPLQFDHPCGTTLVVLKRHGDALLRTDQHPAVVLAHELVAGSKTAKVGPSLVDFVAGDKVRLRDPSLLEARSASGKTPLDLANANGGACYRELTALHIRYQKRALAPSGGGIGVGSAEGQQRLAALEEMVGLIAAFCLTDTSMGSRHSRQDVQRTLVNLATSVPATPGLWSAGVQTAVDRWGENAEEGVVCRGEDFEVGAAARQPRSVRVRVDKLMASLGLTSESPLSVEDAVRIIKEALGILPAQEGGSLEDQLVALENVVSRA
jgi:hypothetical protein